MRINGFKRLGRRRVLRILCAALCVFMAVQPLVSYSGEIVVQSTSSDDSLKVTPMMSMPVTGFEGHEVVISDASLYKVGLEGKSTEDVYGDGQVYMELLIYDSKNEEFADISSGDKKYEKKAVFRKAGNYGIEMVLHLDDGRELSVRKRISVEKTPYTESALAGAKKQERLQRIEFRTAQNPEYPLDYLNLEIKTADGKERASMKFMSGGQTLCSGGSSPNIIVRLPEAGFDDNKNFFSGSIEFMTLFDEDTDLMYEINAGDIRGNTHTVSEEFTVLKDRAPEAAIDMSDTYIREESSNHAVVTVEDASRTDGDTLERQWFVKYQDEEDYRNIADEPGYMDISDGSSSKVSFYKTGVGVFYVKLKVKDVWSEGTMDEFTADSERLGDETEYKSEVVNIAPHVSVGAHSLKKADVIVVSDKEDEEHCESFSEEITEKFLSNGAEAEISCEYLDISRADESGDELRKTFTHEAPFGYKGSSTAFENELYAVDDTNFYSLDAVWSDPDKGFPEEPYTIAAKSGEDGSEIWNFQFDSDIFALDYNSAYMYQDDSEKYLYITSSEKTMILSKKTGRPVTTIDYAVGEYNFVNENMVYTYKNDGIYRVSLEDGSVSTVWNGNLSGNVRRIHGYVVTFTRNAQGSVVMIALDTSDGSVKEKNAGKITSDMFMENGKKFNSSKALNVVGIDVDGCAVVELNIPVYNDRVSSSLSHYKSVIQVYDNECRLIKQFERKDEYNMKTFAVRDRRGAYNYIGVSHDGDDSVTVEIMGIYDDYAADKEIYDSNGDPAIFSEIISAEQMNGKVYVTIGGMCIWIYNQTWGNGPSHGYPARCTCFEFDTVSGSAVKTDLQEGCIGFSEYSKSSNMYMAVRSAQNSQYMGYASIYNNIVKRQQSTFDILYRVFQKNMKYDSGADHKVIYIADSEICSSLSDEQGKKLAEVAQKAGYGVYIKADENQEGLNVIGGAHSVSSEEDAAEDIVNSTLEIQKSDFKFTSVNTAGGTEGKATRSFDLKEDKQYFYEFMVKSSSEPDKAVNISHSLLPTLSEETYADDVLYVSDSEKEDFNGGNSDINEFFEYEKYTSAGGLYTDCYILRDRKSNVFLDKSSYIRFTVPEGKQGVISFDYIIYNSLGSADMNSNYAEIDGERWEEVPGTSGNGHYIHPYILQPGEHEIKLYACEYDSKFITYTYIDNLKLSYVSDEPSQVNSAEENISRRSDGVYKVSGSFMTPGSETCFREMKDISYKCGKPGEVEYTRIETGEDDEYMYIDIPEGIKALCPSVKLKSYAPRRYSVSYTMSDFVKAVYYNDPKSEGNKIYMITNLWRYIMPALEGSHNFHAEFDSYKKTEGEFSEIEMYISKDTNISVENHRYIKSENSKGEKTLFLSENMYGEKTDFSIILDSGTEALYDFNLYTVENGRRIYIEQNGFSDKVGADKWNADNVILKYGESSSDGEQDDITAVYGKGQFIDYNVIYWDHEGDPSKKSFWRYMHTPGDDGAFENADVILDSQGNIISESGIILNEPVNRFYKEGKYTVEHWQEDDTSRGAAASGEQLSKGSYDKESNHVFITFYIGSIEDAPWIEYIKTVPDDVYEGDTLGLEVGLDDADKEDLSLSVQIYCGSEIIAEKSVSGIKASGGVYESLKISDIVHDVKCGIYRVICSVSDSKGVSSESIKFNVTALGNMEGVVYHTDKWEENRKNTERNSNVFWPGERLMLKADVEGVPVSVSAWIEGEEDEKYILNNEEDKTGVYRGSIWQSDMLTRWGSAPVEKKIIFSAEYKNGDIKLSEYSIIFDNSKLYWNIYRKKGA